MPGQKMAMQARSSTGIFQFGIAPSAAGAAGQRYHGLRRHRHCTATTGTTSGGGSLLSGLLGVGTNGSSSWVSKAAT